MMIYDDDDQYINGQWYFVAVNNIEGKRSVMNIWYNQIWYRCGNTCGQIQRCHCYGLPSYTSITPINGYHNMINCNTVGYIYR